MKAKLLSQGNDGVKHWNAGDEYTSNNEFIRRQLVNGLADPLDDEAKAVVGNKEFQERYGSNALKAEADVIRKAHKVPEVAPKK